MDSGVPKTMRDILPGSAVPSPLIIGVLMINADLFHREALVNFILILFLIDACRYLYVFFRSWRNGNVDLG